MAFSFKTEVLLADISNLALDTYADVMDAFERLVLSQDVITEAQKHHIQQAISDVFNIGLAGLDQAAINFERMAAATELRVPPELLVEQPVLAAAAPPSPEEEAALDAELVHARAEVQQARRSVWSLKAQLRAVQEDLEDAGDPSDVKPLMDAVAANKVAIMEDVGAVAAAAGKLQGLLAHSRRLQHAAGSGADQGHADGGGAAAGVGGGAPDAAAAVEWRVRQRMVDSGASLAYLKALRKTLAA